MTEVTVDVPVELLNFELKNEIEASLYVSIGATPAKAKIKKRTNIEKTVNFMLGQRQLFLETILHIQMKNTSSATKMRMPTNWLYINWRENSLMPDQMAIPSRDKIDRFNNNL